MTDDAPLVEQVRTWLENNGLLLEMRVARVLASQGASVTQGYHYIDSVEGKEREGDVSGLFLRIDGLDLHGLDVAVECKSTTAPWVLFHGNSWADGPWRPWQYFQKGCLVC